MSTTQHARFMPQNDFLNSTISITPTPPTGFDQEDLKIYDHSAVVQTTTDPSYPTPPYTAVPNMVITGDFDGFKRMSAIAIEWSNLTVGAVARLKIWNEPSQAGTLVYDSGEISALRAKTLGEWLWCIDNAVEIYEYGSNIGRTSQWYFDTVLGQSFEITLSNPTNTNGFIEINNVFLGEYITTSRNFQYGQSWGIIDYTEQKIAQDGTLVAIAGIESDKLSLEYINLSIDDRILLNDRIVRPNGKHTAFWVDLFPEGNTTLRSHHLGIFHLTNEAELNLENGNLSTVTLELQRK